MTEEPMPAERPIPQPVPEQSKPTTLLDDIHNVRKEIDALSVNWSANTHDAILEREHWMELGARENTLTAQYLADFAASHRGMLPEKLRKARIETGSNQTTFTVRFRLGSRKFVEFSRTSHVFDPTSQEWGIDRTKLGNGIKVPFMDNKAEEGAFVSHGDFMRLEDFLDPSKAEDVIPMLSKQLERAAEQPIDPLWGNEEIAGLKSILAIETTPIAVQNPKSV